MNTTHYFACVSLLSVLVLFACSSKEEPEAKSKEKSETVVVKEEPKPEVAPVVAEEEPALKPMVSNAEQEKVQKEPEVSAVVQGKSGSYVIQVGILPSKKAANALVSKLAEKNITAYLSEVENPGELEGTYYRVRIGYFTTIHDAQTFGKTVLETAGFPWWIDNRANDSVGNPENGAHATSYSSYNAEPESYTSAPAELVYTAQTETPEETPNESAPMESAEGTVDAQDKAIEEAPVAPAAPEGEAWE